MERKVRRLGVSLIALGVGFVLLLGGAAAIKADSPCLYCSATCPEDFHKECSARGCGEVEWMGFCTEERTAFCRYGPKHTITVVCIERAADATGPSGPN